MQTEAMRKQNEETLKQQREMSLELQDIILRKAVESKMAMQVASARDTFWWSLMGSGSIGFGVVLEATRHKTVHSSVLTLLLLSSLFTAFTWDAAYGQKANRKLSHYDIVDLKKVCKENSE